MPESSEVKRGENMGNKTLELILALAAAALNFGAKLFDYWREKRSKRRKR